MKSLTWFFHESSLSEPLIHINKVFLAYGLDFADIFAYAISTVSMTLQCAESSLAVSLTPRTLIFAMKQCSQIRYLSMWYLCCTYVVPVPVPVPVSYFAVSQNVRQFFFSLRVLSFNWFKYPRLMG